MQDDTYLIAVDGWVEGAQPREVVQVRYRDNKLVWPEPHDYLKGRRRFKSDLIPASILVARYFAAECDAIEALDNALARLEQALDEQREEQGGEDGLLAEVIEGEGDKQKITANSLNATPHPCRCWRMRWTFWPHGCRSTSGRWGLNHDHQSHRRCRLLAAYPKGATASRLLSWSLQRRRVEQAQRFHPSTPHCHTDL
jgi:hypothetical protein